MHKQKVILLLALLALLFTILHFKPEEGQKKLSQGFFGDIVVSLTEPVQNVFSSTYHFVGGLFSRYFWLVGVKDKNISLSETVAFQKAYIASLKERLKESNDISSLDDLVASWGLEGVHAKMLAYDPIVQSQTVWLSAGASDGIEVDQPVITQAGLAGRIIKVFSKTSQALLLVDANFAVDVIDQETRVRALVAGTGQTTQLSRYPLLTHLEFLRLGDEIHTGDLLVTSGINGIYPPSIPVGYVVKIADFTDTGEKSTDSLYKSTVVMPVTDFSKLDRVMILKRIPPRIEEPKETKPDIQKSK